MLNNKKIAVLGGGTNTYISNHLALSAGVDNWDGYDLAKEMYHDEE